MNETLIADFLIKCRININPKYFYSNCLNTADILSLIAGVIFTISFVILIRKLIDYAKERNGEKDGKQP